MAFVRSLLVTSLILLSACGLIHTGNGPSGIEGKHRGQVSSCGAVFTKQAIADFNREASLKGGKYLLGTTGWSATCKRNGRKIEGYSQVQVIPAIRAIGKLTERAEGYYHARIEVPTLTTADRRAIAERLGVRVKGDLDGAIVERTPEASYALVPGVPYARAWLDTGVEGGQTVPLLKLASEAKDQKAWQAFIASGEPLVVYGPTLFGLFTPEAPVFKASVHFETTLEKSGIAQESLVEMTRALWDQIGSAESHRFELVSELRLWLTAAPAWAPQAREELPGIVSFCEATWDAQGAHAADDAMRCLSFLGVAAPKPAIAPYATRAAQLEPYFAVAPAEAWLRETKWLVESNPYTESQEAAVFSTAETLGLRSQVGVWERAKSLADQLAFDIRRLDSVACLWSWLKSYEGGYTSDEDAWRTTLLAAADPAMDAAVLERFRDTLTWLRSESGPAFSRAEALRMANALAFSGNLQPTTWGALKAGYDWLSSDAGPGLGKAEAYARAEHYALSEELDMNKLEAIRRAYEEQARTLGRAEALTRAEKEVLG